MECLLCARVISSWETPRIRSLLSRSTDLLLTEDKLIKKEEEEKKRKERDILGWSSTVEMQGLKSAELTKGTIP